MSKILRGPTFYSSLMWAISCPRLNFHDTRYYINIWMTIWFIA